MSQRTGTLVPTVLISQTITRPDNKVDIGIDPAIADVSDAPEVWTVSDCRDLVPLPAPDAHKNSRGRLLIVDFAPHDLDELRTHHAHRRLGIAAEHMAQWLSRAGLTLTQHDVLPPPWRKEGQGLTVSLWLATAPQPTRSPTPQMDRAT